MQINIMKHHDMETLSASLALCKRNHCLSADCPDKGAVMLALDYFSVPILKKCLILSQIVGDFRRLDVDVMISEW